MEGFVLAFQVVFPMLVLMGIGYIVKRWLKITEDALKQMNKLVFNLFLPAVIFKNIYRSDLSEDFNGKLFVFGGVAILITFAVLYFIVPKFVKKCTDASVLIQAIFRSNNVLFGVTIIYAVYGQEAMGTTSLLAALAVFIYSILAVFLFESMRGEKTSPTGIAKSIIKNPLIIATLLGTAVLLLDVKLPQMSMDIIDDIGGIATPLALMVLGATFQLKGFIQYRKMITVSTVTKLLVLPGIVIITAAVVGFEGPAMLMLMSLFGSPTAVSSYPTAEALGGNGELAGLMVVFTSVCSLFSIFLWVLILKTSGLL